MKKGIISFMAVGMLFLGLAATSHAAGPALSYFLTVTITSDPFALKGPNADLSYKPLGNVALSPTTGYGVLTYKLDGTIMNVGGNVCTVALSITAVPAADSGWLLETGTAPGTPPAPGHYRMSAEFAQWDRAGVGAVTDFTLTDVLSSNAVKCDANTFAFAADDIKFKGYNIPTGDNRNFYMLVEAQAGGTGVPGSVSPTLYFRAVAP
jgi:hypothetical protein